MEEKPDLLPNNIRVLDVGCGDGSLMSVLKNEKNIEVRGLELEKDAKVSPPPIML